MATLQSLTLYGSPDEEVRQRMASLTGVQITFMLAGTVLVERVFSYEGIGSMAIDAVTNRDLPLIQGIILAFAVMFVAINLAVDIGLTFLDPRLRHG